MDILDKSRIESSEKLTKLKKEIKNTFEEKNDFYKHLCVYACGSLGRLEVMNDSDLDLFFILANKKKETFKCSNLDKYNFFAKLHTINKNNKFKSPTKDGAYWEFISEKDLLDIGSRNEDYINSFTARMLLILESTPLYNDKLYNDLIDKVLEKYFKDFVDHADNFMPMFLINDILRYWYTLTLNYEYRRDPGDDTNEKCWKRLKLKFARLLTCYSLIACMFEKEIDKNKAKEYIRLTPLERLDLLAKKNSQIAETVKQIKFNYTYYIQLKNEDPSRWEDEKNRDEAYERSDEFHKLIMKLMTKVSELNPELRKKMDIY